MATDMIGGMFGPTPEEIRLAQYQQGAQNAAAMAGMDATQRGVMGMMQGGAGLVNTLAPVFGFKNQALEQANARHDMIRGTDLNLQDPASLREAALRIRQVDPQMAMRLGMLANQREKEQSQMTLEAAQTKKALRDNPNLEKIEVPQGNDMYRMALLDSTGQRPLEYISGPYKGQKLGGSGGGWGKPFTMVNPNTGEQRIVTMEVADRLAQEGWEDKTASGYVKAELARSGEYGKGGAESMQADYNAFRAAETTIPKLEGVIKLIKNGNVVTGPAANLRLGLQKARQFFLDSKAANANVTDTQVLNALLGSDVFGMIQSLGIGARGMDTPAEREFLREVMTGTIELNDQALIRMAEIRLEQQKKARDRWLQKSSTQRKAFKRDFLGDVEAVEAGGQGADLPAGFKLD